VFGDDYGPIFNVDTTNGRVGIGTTAPGYPFQIMTGGSSKFEVTSAGILNTGSYIVVYGASGSGSSAKTYITSGQIYGISNA